MESQQQKSVSKSKSYIQAAGLLLLLLVLPLGSWYYLSSGLNYQREARGELKDYGTVPAFQFVDQDQNVVTADSLKGNMVLASFFFKGHPENASRFKTLQALHEQFDDRKKIWFIQHVFPTKQGAAIDLKAFAQEKDFEDLGQIFYLSGDQSSMEAVLADGYKMPKEGLPKNEAGEIQLEATFPSPINDYPYFVLIDEVGKIRSYYDSSEPGQMKRLVEHMSFVMPRE